MIIIKNNRYAQVFGTLRAFTPWIQRNASELVNIITAIVQLIFKTLSITLVSKNKKKNRKKSLFTPALKKPTIIGKSACILLESLGNALPMIQLPITQELLLNAPKIIQLNDFEVKKRILWINSLYFISSSWR